MFSSQVVRMRLPATFPCVDVLAVISAPTLTDQDWSQQWGQQLYADEQRSDR